jgi:hypothetical protein
MSSAAPFKSSEDACRAPARIRSGQQPVNRGPQQATCQQGTTGSHDAGINPMFKTENFMMYGFKIAMCTKQGRHPWGDCPYAHPTENARRRDPRVFSYGCVECPSYRYA